MQSELYVVCLKFQQRKLDFPSFETKDRHEDLSDEADDEGQAGGDSRNSLPHPFLLFLRSLNAWCNFLHTQHKWSAWNEHLQKLEPVHIGTRSCTLDSKVPLVLLLSCRDVEIDGGDCIYCKAADVCENPSLYSGLSDDLLQAAQAILQHSKSVTDEEAEKILGLKRDDSAGADSYPASERKGDGAAEEEGQRSQGSEICPRARRRGWTLCCPHAPPRSGSLRRTEEDGGSGTAGGGGRLPPSPAPQLASRPAEGGGGSRPAVLSGRDVRGILQTKRPGAPWLPPAWYGRQPRGLRLLCPSYCASALFTSFPPPHSWTAPHRAGACATFFESPPCGPRRQELLAQWGTY